ncbi:complex I NDUFA9 subunit family protein [Sulfuricystis multivorans]|uniref:complex I NDUFA9 subunit family protein n=1 Tax=Sulfuricystis multivorans TaxID=2211108 RepID=UPI000F84D9ED|nr:complex I NDUFA9 subunit family protein [Sulfuricystis multivorans]
MKKALLIGGTGFLGSALACRLGRADFALTLPTRRRERVKHLTVLPAANVVEADVHDEETLARLMAGQDLVVNLVGILKGDFQRAHVELPGKIARAAAVAHVSRLIHISALGATADAPSEYLRSKAAGEAAVKAFFPQATIFQPSVIFGRGDSFLTLFAGLLAIAPLVPLACPQARFTPVWVEDVVSSIVASLDYPESQGQTYPLCGPRIYTLRELVAYTGWLSGHPRPIIGLPLALSYLQALIMEWLPNGPMTRDNVRSMQVPNVCPEGSTLPFGLTATPLEAVAPDYLAKR